MLESAAKDNTNDRNKSRPTKKRKTKHIGEVQQRLREIMRRHLHGDDATAESLGDSSSESDPEPVADDEGSFEQSRDLSAQVQPPAIQDHPPGPSIAASDDGDAIPGDQDENEVLRPRHWLLYTDNDIRRPFTDLPSEVQKSLAQKFRSDYFAESQDGKPASAQKNHKAFLTTTTDDGCALLVITKRCLNIRIYHAGKDIKAPVDQACKKCLAAHRICIRPIKVDGKHRLCLFPHKSKEGQLLGEWSDSSRWTAEST
jgi:hypothetical protein